MFGSTFFITALFLIYQPIVWAAPASSESSASPDSPSSPSSVSSAPTQSFTAGLTSDDPNDSLFDQFQNEIPEAIRGTLGATVIGPQNVIEDRLSPDFLAPPSTDAGSVANAKWPFSLSHNRLQTGGWARQENVQVMPIATEMAGVDMRLQAERELHWHSTGEWGFIFKGQVQITAVMSGGTNYIADLDAGDVWYFPSGIPHSIQATNQSAAGAEFLLVFDSGSFSEDDTFLLTDWLAHIPKEILAKNFRTSIEAFDHIPATELYIFPSSPPPPAAQNAVSDPNGQVPQALSFPWSKSARTPLAGGSVKILDSTTFPISQTIAAADVTVGVGGMRELHWHPTQDEWSYFISGTARVTIFAAEGNARTFDYQAGDIGYVPASCGHYVENIGNDTLEFLEIFKSNKFEDISLNQWLALTPPDLVKAHLNIDDATIALFNKSEQTVV
ncbi:hypothetical protein Clacol_009222 [Clathrus columnatus]|uniref:Cupin type-1 domain-containing protein n=1 Tax=Clathrus columnatus TaxID=1419009 RepID=A0AAV5AMK5_9AGAM|nr:hypothetical protein Clacol_009222 [Clathrus columnatus]